MVKNTTIKVNLIFTFFLRKPKGKKTRKRRRNPWWIKILINNFSRPGTRLRKSKTRQSRNGKITRNFFFRFFFASPPTEDGSSAHLSWAHTPRHPGSLSLRWAGEGDPSMAAKATNISPKEAASEFMYSTAYRTAKKAKKSQLSFGYFFFLVFLVNINHLIVFFSGRSNRPVEIINVFVICEQFGVSIFSVFPLTLSGRVSSAKAKRQQQDERRKKMFSR